MYFIIISAQIIIKYTHYIFTQSIYDTFDERTYNTIYIIFFLCIYKLMYFKIDTIYK